MSRGRKKAHVLGQKSWNIWTMLVNHVMKCQQRTFSNLSVAAKQIDNWKFCINPQWNLIHGHYMSLPSEKGIRPKLFYYTLLKKF